VSGTAQLAADEANTRRDCTVVEHDPLPARSSDRMTTTVTACGGKVSGSTTGDGSPVTVHSGDGSTSSSVATAGASGGSTVVAESGSGDCVIYKDTGRKVEDHD
jgi:hypothetical protein